MNANWFYEIKELDEPVNNKKIDGHFNTSIRDIKVNSLPDILDFQKNIVIQWIVFPFLSDKTGLSYQIPIYSANMHTYIKDHIEGYFEVSQGIFENNTLTMLRLSKLKDEYKSFLNDHFTENEDFIHPIIRDFYWDHKKSINVFDNVDAVNLELDIQNFNKHVKTRVRANEDLWNFFEQAYIDIDGNMIISPQNWIFNDELVKSAFLAYVSKYANRIILTVNKLNQHIRAIEIR